MRLRLEEDERKWILRTYWHVKNTETVREEWRALFNSTPAAKTSIYKLAKKFDQYGNVKVCPETIFAR
jgi:hypothetical protein